MTVIAAAVLVDVVVIQSEVTVSVTTSGCGSGARLSRLLAFSRRSLLSLRYFDISKGAALSATRRNLALAMGVYRAAAVTTVGVIVQVGSG